MSDDIYYQLRNILDKMPNGYPATNDGLEIRILKKIFTEEDASIAVKLKMKFETADAIAARTGLDPGYMKNKLKEMADNGEIFGVTIGPMKIYKLLPFVFGIYEMQINRLDKELVDMIEEYFNRDFGEMFYNQNPPLMRVIPIEEKVLNDSKIEPYEHLTEIIDRYKSFAINDCICKKEKEILGERCGKPMEVCLAIAPMEHVFDDFFWGRPITKEEALEVLKKSEQAGLVHMTSNTKEGNIYICNCCGCCCGILRGYNERGFDSVVGRSSYRAVVDADLCTNCGVCLDRCQVRAIDMNEIAAINERCIGCGLCVSTCPTDAVKLVKRDVSLIPDVPQDEKEWNLKQAANRGRDDYKDLL